jgi:hypothetical protein
MSVSAVYEVTRALRVLLHSQLILVHPGAVVTLLPPGDQLPDVTGVNLYLYRVNESPFSKNKPWAGDKKTGPSNQPALGLQLFYLLTPLATKPDDASFALGDDAHTMLGVSMATLQENPVLNYTHIPGFDADTVLAQFLLDSYEKIKVTLMPTNLDELSKIWATINQPYRLSVAYEVSLVEITPSAAPPVGGGVVLTSNLTVATLDRPALSALTPPAGALAHVVGGALQANDLILTGFGFVLGHQVASAQVGGQLVVVKTIPAPTNTTLTVTLPLSLQAGPQEDVTATLNDRTSFPLSFTVNPWLDKVTPVRTALDPPGAQAVLDGIGFTATPQAVRMDGPGGTTNVSVFVAASDSQVTFDLPGGLVNGLYQVRVILNDAPSSATNARVLEVIPRLDSPIGLLKTLVGGNQVHQLTLNGARLNGADVRLIIDGVVYALGVHGDPNQIVFALGRLLDAGSHSVSVNVNGQMSHTVVLQV